LGFVLPRYLLCTNLNKMGFGRVFHKIIWSLCFGCRSSRKDWLWILAEPESILWNSGRNRFIKSTLWNFGRKSYFKTETVGSWKIRPHILTENSGQKYSSRNWFTKSPPGFDIMITIFCDFRQFLAKKWRFSQKPMLWSQFFAIFDNFRRKNGVFLKNQCYDHNFRRFSTIFGEKIGVSLKNQCYDQDFAQFSFVLNQKRQFFRWIFRRKLLKNRSLARTILVVIFFWNK
jgi:hypothetical protein